MSHTYASNFVHCVFSTKQRAATIPHEQQEQLWAYLFGIARNKRIPVLAIGGTCDHVHLLLSLPPTCALAKVVCDLKANSSRWLRETVARFGWQEGYGAFSVNPSRISAVQSYIRNQGEHHKRRDFAEEFRELLQQAGISVGENVSAV